MLKLRQEFYEKRPILKSVTMHEGLRAIGRSAFADCCSLDNLELPTTVITIGAMAFSSCTKLASVTLPAGVEVLEERTFAKCTALTAVECAPSSKLSIIRDGAFRNCVVLADYCLPSPGGELSTAARKSGTPETWKKASPLPPSPKTAVVIVF